jgi:hypothetical protein
MFSIALHRRLFFALALVSVAAMMVRSLRAR